jgi:hypothetical protein
LRVESRAQPSVSRLTAASVLLHEQAMAKKSIGARPKSVA